MAEGGEAPPPRPSQEGEQRNSRRVSGVNQVEGLNNFRASLDPQSPQVARASIAKLQEGGAGFDLQDIGLTAKKANVLMQKSALSSSTHIVERETLKMVIEENQRRFTGCLMLPITILFFIFYAGAAVLHEDIAYTHLLESPFRDTLTPGLDEEGGEEADEYMLGGVVTIDNFWTFITETLVPTFFQDEDANGEALPPSKYGRAFMYNQLIGAMVFEQQRSIAQPCEDELAAHMTCYPSGELSTADYGRPWTQMGNIDGMTAAKYFLTPPADGTQAAVACPTEGFSVTPCSSRRLEILRDELTAKMPKIGDKADTYKFFLFQNQPAALINKRIQYLKERGYMDINTNRVLIKALVLNNELDIPRVDSIRLTFFLSRGGGMYTMLRMECIFLQSYSRGLSYLYDALFVFLLVCSTCFSTFEVLRACIRRNLREYFSIINVVVWFNILIGWFNIVGFISFGTSRKDVADKLGIVLKDNSEESITALHDAADDFVYFAGWFRVFVADAHIVFMLRCFIALQWQPRLAVVTQTLKETTVDLFHFLIVFVPTFIAFAIAGNQMFGRRMQEFATIEGAIALCFKLAMESEFDWWYFSQEDMKTAMTWVWLYILLVVLLMMNMVLAIMMDVYSVIRLRAGNSETIWANIIFLVRRAWLAKKWVGDKVLLERVADMPRTVSQAELLRHIPELTDFQLRRLMQGCATKAQAVMRMGVHESYTAQMTAAIKLGLDSIQMDISRLKDRGWMGRGVEAGSLNSRMLAQDILQSAAIQTHWMNLMQTQLDTLRKKTHGLSEVANLLVTFYSATGVLATKDAFASCNIAGKPNDAVRSRAVDVSGGESIAGDIEWDEEHELIGYVAAEGLAVEFSIFDATDTSICICKMVLPGSAFYPNGWEGDLPFPGGALSAKIEIVNPLAETTV